MKSKHDIILVYNSVTMWYLRCILFFAPVLCIWESIVTRQYWLNFFTVILLVVQVYVFHIINRYLIISGDGITYRYKSNKHTISWDEVKYTSVVEMKYIGSIAPTSIVIFAKDRINIRKLKTNKVLPRFEGDFVFAMDQPRLRVLIRNYAPDNIVSRLFPFDN